jgi:hypothetical protein
MCNEARNAPAWGEMQGRIEATARRAEAAEARVRELEAMVAGRAK